MSLRFLVLALCTALAASFAPGVVPVQRAALHSRPALLMGGNPLEDAMAMVSSFFKQVHKTGFAAYPAARLQPCFDSMRSFDVHRTLTRRPPRSKSTVATLTPAAATWT